MQLGTVKNSGAIAGAAAGMHAAGQGAVFLGPLAILLVPFTAAWGAAEGASCDQQLDAAYPGLLEKFPVIVDRELSLQDMQDQLVARLQEHTSGTIGAEEIRFGSDIAANKQQLLALAAEHGRAHIFLIEVSGVTLEMIGSCEWLVRPRFWIELWRVGDRKLVRTFANSYHPLWRGSLSDLSSILDRPGALRESAFERQFEGEISDAIFGVALPP
jgi:hypothetical protein